jgi:hypothetical protein
MWCAVTWRATTLYLCIAELQVAVKNIINMEYCTTVLLRRTYVAGNK